MKKILILFFLVFLLSGCATEAYYLNPQSAGYNQQVWNCVCEKCNRVFTISSSQYDSGAYVSCCYCGDVQDPRLARNRGRYAEEHAQPSPMGQAIMGAMLNNYMQQPSVNAPGSYTNPIHVKVKDY